MKEMYQIFEKAFVHFKNNELCVLATIVKVEGSGYRREGTRMLISENGIMTGAVSGGCVEKEVFREAQSVFETAIPKLMSYDGRYRLGCEGVLYIFIEQIQINQSLFTEFAYKYRNSRLINVTTYYLPEKQRDFCGTLLDHEITLKPHLIKSLAPADAPDLKKYEQNLLPTKKLFILGAEHDAKSLTKIASLSGWDVTVVCHPLNTKDRNYFEGCFNFLQILPADIDQLQLDKRSAVVFMSHSYSRDLAYLQELSKTNFGGFIGLLGPAKRRNQLLDALIEKNPMVADKFLDHIYGPVGLDIGAETPGEIALSILAEIQCFLKQSNAISLRTKNGTIHSR